MTLLDELATNVDPWAVMERIVAAPPENIVAAAGERYARVGNEERRKLIQLVGRLKVLGAEDVLRGWLRGSEPDAAADLLHALNGRGATIDREEIVRLLDAREPAALQAAVVAAGASGDVSVAPLVARQLDAPRVGPHAAIALGRLRATSYTAAVVSRLPALHGLEHAGFIVALELMDDPRAVAPLLEWLARAPAEATWDVHHALARLTGREPVVPQDGDAMQAALARREAWAGLDLTRPPRPRIEQVEVRDAAEIAFVLRDSSGRARVDYDPPSPGSSWPRWSKSLLIDGKPLYDVGSACGTCETCLRLVGWPTDLAALGADGVRRALGDVAGLSPELLDALSPLLTVLQPGHYIVTLVDLDLELVTEPEASWWTRRGELRRSGEDGDREVWCAWPGTAHFQLRSPLPGAEPTFGVVMPSQNLMSLSSSFLDAHQEAIRGGAHPACVALAWVETKYVRAEYDERFLLGVVLDGHHKLAAYARQGVPARALLVCRIEDTWGPPGEGARWFLETTASLKVRGPSPG